MLTNFLKLRLYILKDKRLGIVKMQGINRDRITINPENELLELFGGTKWPLR